MMVLNEDLKRNIRESLIYAVLQIQGRNKKTYRRLVITEFYHSLNRKSILLNYETEEEVKKALEQLEALSYPIPNTKT
jgi:predicted metalloprotease with PDZ domain